MSDVLSCASPTEWEAWLAAHWQRPTGVWLKIAKKGSPVISVTVSEALDVALCYGWIDGTRRRLDEQFFLQWYCPRRPRSAWSKVNVARVEALVAAGRMRPPGLAQVEAAKADGRWAAAYESQRNATAPPDLMAALDRDDQAQAAFELLGRSERYAVVLPLLKARTPQQRAERLRAALARLRAGRPAP
ncbi:MAG TPA: YdeI/OmpD-associated family protein [Actinomycetes bacterium]